MIEHLDRRVMGAIRLIDAATGAQVIEALDVTAENGTLLRNRIGLYVITGVTGMEAYAASFQSAPAAPSVDLLIQVRDAQRRYLPRTATVRLPRLAPVDPTPEQAADAGSVFRPIELRVFRSAGGGTLPSWAVIRATVVEQGNPDNRLSGALIRVLRRSNGGVVVARALSDTRGESLVAVPGIAVVVPGEGEGSVVDLFETVRVQVIYDPAVQGIPDPDDLESRMGSLATLEVELNLTSGREIARRFEIDLS